MKENETNNYVAPEVIVMEIDVEKGFAASIPVAGGEDLTKFPEKLDLDLDLGLDLEN